MEIIILLISVSLLALTLTFLKKNRRLKILSLFVILFATGITLLFTTMDNVEVNGEEIISSFLAGNTLKIEKTDFSDIYEDEVEWDIYNPEMSELRLSGRSFSLKPSVECLWGKKSTGPMIFRAAEGDFYFSSLIRTRLFSDTLAFPRERAWQFGGIMLRDTTSEKNENNIYIAVGRKDTELHIEVKSTTNGVSSSENFKWPSGDAELMIQREAVVFGLYARPYGTKGPWTQVQTFYRPDLSNTLQAGLFVYSYSYGRNLNDFIAYFDDVNVRRENE
jgi:hypothetical protein